MLAVFVYVLELVAVIGFVITGPPMELSEYSFRTRTNCRLVLIGAGIILLGFGFFYTLGKIGETLMRRIEDKESPKVLNMVTVEA